MHSYLSIKCCVLSAIELVKELMEYEVAPVLLGGLVSLLRPAKEDVIQKPDLLDGEFIKSFTIVTLRKMLDVKESKLATFWYF